LTQLSQRVVGAGGSRLDAVTLPFADSDFEATLHAGQPELARLVLARGRAVYQQVLGVPATAALAVPPGSSLDGEGVDLLSRTGTAATLSAPASPPRSGSGSASATVSTLAGSAGTTLTALAPDRELNGVIDAGPTGAPTPRLAEQSVFAELAQAYLGSAPSASGAPVVIAPPRDWDPGGNWAARITGFSASVPWLRPVGLSSLLETASPGRSGRAAGAEEPDYPEQVRAAELPASTVSSVGATLNDARGFAEALPPGQTTTSAVTDTALTALSSWWRPDLAASDDRLRSAEAGLDELSDSVRVVASPEITLTSRNGRLPVTLENNLPQTVNVTLVLTSLDRSRVRSDTSVSRLIQPGQKVQVEVAVRATSAGTFPVRLALQTPTGRQIGPAHQVLVRSTAAGVVAIGVTVAALAVLLLVDLGRAVRTLLRRRRPPGPDGGSGPERADRDSGEQVAA
jgi:hypothetical protein